MRKNILKTVSEKIQHIWKKNDLSSVQERKQAVSEPEKEIKECRKSKEEIKIEKKKQRSWSDFDFDRTDGETFEYFCAELLRANGFTNVELTKKTGDLGVDILAEKEQITYAVQCKCHASNIGNQAVRDIYSGKECYHCMIGVVMTNRFFTKAAAKLAAEHNILLWDREYLFQLIKNAEKNVYEVGKDLDPGEYRIFGEREKRWKCTVSKERNGKSVLFQIIAEGCYTVEVREKEYLILEEAYLKPAVFESYEMENNGWFAVKVGRDLAAGEYQIFAADEEISGYYAIYKSARYMESEKLEEEFFENKSFVILREGTYFWGENCYIEKR
ncbi:MAG: restriction endonuclease [Eubacteriales bacterium]|nr:restriction endonuclease [Eubacteriales bacterium]